MVGISVDFNMNILEKDIIDRFLKSMASKWTGYGTPVNEILISRNDGDTVIYNEKIEMVNIFFNYD